MRLLFSALVVVGIGLSKNTMELGEKIDGMRILIIDSNFYITI